MVRVIINNKEVRADDLDTFYGLMLRMVGIERPVSLQTLKDRINVVFDLVVDFCDMNREEVKGAEKAKFTRAKNKISSSRIYWERIRDKEIFIKRYYDFLLSVEGNGTLPGFGFSNKFGDHISGDAERISVTSGSNLLKG